MSEVENIHTDITLGDVRLMLQILEVCSKRGAFHPTEFVPIGQLTQKLNAVVSSASAEPETETKEPEQLEFSL